VRDIIREAEVELRESAYYPRAESRRHLSEAASNLVAAEQALRTAPGILEAPGETLPEPRPRTEEKEKQKEYKQKEDKVIMPPTRILLATDGSKDAELATNAAIELANTTGSELHVVYVGDFVPSPHAYPEDKLGHIVERVTRRAHSVLGERIALIAAAGGGVSGDHVRVGRPAEEIVALAEEIGAGLIVMGSRGLGRVRRALMGSISDSVVRHAHCPVLVIRGGESEGPVLLSKKMLLATVGSEDAALAARTAAGLAQKMGSELHVVYVRPRIVPHRPGYYLGPEAVEDAERKEREGLEREAQRLLDAQAEEVRGAGGSVARAHLRVGRPDEEIVDLAEELGVGLIVMGSRGQEGVRRALLGSVSDSVVRHAHCPVLVVRQDQR
jgi:nucleotide-binding universal stress UspA family protein